MLVVVKPNQAKCGQEHCNWLKKRSKEKDIELEWYFTQGHFNQDVSSIRALAKKHTEIVVVGGDGSIHLVVNAIMALPCRLAILPAGTGNDFVRQFKRSMAQWRSCVFSETMKNVDVGKVNERYFINIAGVGFGAEVVKDIDTFEQRNKLSYVIAGAKKIFAFRGIYINNSMSMMLLFANGQYFAAGLKAAPKANVQNKSLRVMHFKAGNLWQRIWSFLLMFIAQHERSDLITSIDAQTYRINEADLPLEADGELIGVTPANIRCIPGAIKLKI